MGSIIRLTWPALSVWTPPDERDVFSIEHETCYRDLAVESDNTSVFYVARAIHLLQKVTGEAPLVKGKGPAAKEARPCTSTAHNPFSETVYFRSYACFQATFWGLFWAILGYFGLFWAILADFGRKQSFSTTIS